MSADQPNDDSSPDVTRLEREIDLSMRRADEATRHRPRTRRSPGLIVLAVVLALALAATAVLAAYLWRTTDEWRAETERVARLANEIATERDDLAAELNQSERDLAATEEQLREVQDRLLSLADERAQTGDELELARLVNEEVGRVVGDLQQVSAEMRQCVQGQSDLIEVLENIELYDPDSVAEGAQLINDVCQQALQRHENLQEELRNR